MKDYVAENELILNEWRESNEKIGEKKFACVGRFFCFLKCGHSKLGKSVIKNTRFL